MLYNNTDLVFWGNNILFSPGSAGDMYTEVENEKVWLILSKCFFVDIYAADIWPG